MQPPAAQAGATAVFTDAAQTALHTLRRLLRGEEKVGDDGEGHRGMRAHTALRHAASRAQAPPHRHLHPTGGEGRRRRRRQRRTAMQRRRERSSSSGTRTETDDPPHIGKPSRRGEVQPEREESWSSWESSSFSDAEQEESVESDDTLEQSRFAGSSSMVYSTTTSPRSSFETSSRSSFVSSYSTKSRSDGDEATAPTSGKRKEKCSEEEDAEALVKSAERRAKQHRKGAPLGTHKAAGGAPTTKAATNPVAAKLLRRASPARGSAVLSQSTLLHVAQLVDEQWRTAAALVETEEALGKPQPDEPPDAREPPPPDGGVSTNIYHNSNTHVRGAMNPSRAPGVSSATVPPPLGTMTGKLSTSGKGLSSALSHSPDSTLLAGAQGAQGVSSSSSLPTRTSRMSGRTSIDGEAMRTERKSAALPVSTCVSAADKEECTGAGRRRVGGGERSAEPNSSTSGGAKKTALVEEKHKRLRAAADEGNTVPPPPLDTAAGRRRKPGRTTLVLRDRLLCAWAEALVEELQFDIQFYASRAAATTATGGGGGGQREEHQNGAGNVTAGRSGLVASGSLFLSPHAVATPNRIVTPTTTALMRDDEAPPGKGTAGPNTPLNPCLADDPGWLPPTAGAPTPHPLRCSSANVCSPLFFPPFSSTQALTASPRPTPTFSGPIASPALVTLPPPAALHGAALRSKVGAPRLADRSAGVTASSPFAVRFGPPGGSTAATSGVSPPPLGGHEVRHHPLGSSERVQGWPNPTSPTLASPPSVTFTAESGGVVPLVLPVPSSSLPRAVPVGSTASSQTPKERLTATESAPHRPRQPLSEPKMLLLLRAVQGLSHTLALFPVLPEPPRRPRRGYHVSRGDGSSAPTSRHTRERDARRSLPSSLSRGSSFQAGMRRWRAVFDSQRLRERGFYFFTAPSSAWARSLHRAHRRPHPSSSSSSSVTSALTRSSRSSPRSRSEALCDSTRSSSSTDSSYSSSSSASGDRHGRRGGEPPRHRRPRRRHSGETGSNEEDHVQRPSALLTHRVSGGSQRVKRSLADHQAVLFTELPSAPVQVTAAMSFSKHYRVPSRGTAPCSSSTPPSRETMTAPATTTPNSTGKACVASSSPGGEGKEPQEKKKHHHPGGEEELPRRTLSSRDEARGNEPLVVSVAADPDVGSTTTSTHRGVNPEAPRSTNKNQRSSRGAAPTRERCSWRFRTGYDLAHHIFVQKAVLEALLSFSVCCPMSTTLLEACRSTVLMVSCHNYQHASSSDAVREEEGGISRRRRRGEKSQKDAEDEEEGHPLALWGGSTSLVEPLLQLLAPSLLSHVLTPTHLWLTALAIEALRWCDESRVSCYGCPLQGPTSRPLLHSREETTVHYNDGGVSFGMRRRLAIQVLQQAHRVGLTLECSPPYCNARGVVSPPSCAAGLSGRRTPHPAATASGDEFSTEPVLVPPVSSGLNVGDVEPEDGIIVPSPTTTQRRTVAPPPPVGDHYRTLSSSLSNAAIAAMAAVTGSSHHNAQSTNTNTNNHTTNSTPSPPHPSPLAAVVRGSSTTATHHHHAGTWGGGVAGLTEPAFPVSALPTPHGITFLCLPLENEEDLDDAVSEVLHPSPTTVEDHNKEEEDVVNGVEEEPNEVQPLGCEVSRPSSFTVAHEAGPKSVSGHTFPHSSTRAETGFRPSSTSSARSFSGVGATVAAATMGPESGMWRRVPVPCVPATTTTTTTTTTHARPLPRSPLSATALLLYTALLNGLVRGVPTPVKEQVFGVAAIPSLRRTQAEKSTREKSKMRRASIVEEEELFKREGGDGPKTTIASPARRGDHTTTTTTTLSGRRRGGDHHGVTTSCTSVHDGVLRGSVNSFVDTAAPSPTRYGRELWKENEGSFVVSPQDPEDQLHAKQRDDTSHKGAEQARERIPSPALLDACVPVDTLPRRVRRQCQAVQLFATAAAVLQEVQPLLLVDPYTAAAVASGADLSAFLLYTHQRFPTATTTGTSSDAGGVASFTVSPVVAGASVGEAALCSPTPAVPRSVGSHSTSAPSYGFTLPHRASPLVKGGGDGVEEEEEECGPLAPSARRSEASPTTAGGVAGATSPASSITQRLRRIFPTSTPANEALRQGEEAPRLPTAASPSTPSFMHRRVQSAGSSFLQLVSHGRSHSESLLAAHPNHTTTTPTAHGGGVTTNTTGGAAGLPLTSTLSSIPAQHHNYSTSSRAVDAGVPSPVPVSSTRWLGLQLLDGKTLQWELAELWMEWLVTGGSSAALESIRSEWLQAPMPPPLWFLLQRAQAVQEAKYTARREWKQHEERWKQRQRRLLRRSASPPPHRSANVRRGAKEAEVPGAPQRHRERGTRYWERRLPYTREPLEPQVTRSVALLGYYRMQRLLHRTASYHTSTAEFMVSHARYRNAADAGIDSVVCPTTTSLQKIRKIAVVPTAWWSASHSAEKPNHHVNAATTTDKNHSRCSGTPAVLPSHRLSSHSLRDQWWDVAKRLSRCVLAARPRATAHWQPAAPRAGGRSDTTGAQRGRTKDLETKEASVASAEFSVSEHPASLALESGQSPAAGHAAAPQEGAAEGSPRRGNPASPFITEELGVVRSGVERIAMETLLCMPITCNPSSVALFRHLLAAVLIFSIASPLNAKRLTEYGTLHVLIARLLRSEEDFDPPKPAAGEPRPAVEDRPTVSKRRTPSPTTVGMENADCDEASSGSGALPPPTLSSVVPLLSETPLSPSLAPKDGERAFVEGRHSQNRGGGVGWSLSASDARHATAANQGTSGAQWRSSDGGAGTTRYRLRYPRRGVPSSRPPQFFAPFAPGSGLPLELRTLGHLLLCEETEWSTSPEALQDDTAESEDAKDCSLLFETARPSELGYREAMAEERNETAAEAARLTAVGDENDLVGHWEREHLLRCRYFMEHHPGALSWLQRAMRTRWGRTLRHDTLDVMGAVTSSYFDSETLLPLLSTTLARLRAHPGVEGIGHARGGSATASNTKANSTPPSVATPSKPEKRKRAALSTRLVAVSRSLRNGDDTRLGSHVDVAILEALLHSLGGAPHPRFFLFRGRQLGYREAWQRCVAQRQAMRETETLRKRTRRAEKRPSHHRKEAPETALEGAKTKGSRDIVEDGGNTVQTGVSSHSSSPSCASTCTSCTCSESELSSTGRRRVIPRRSRRERGSQELSSYSRMSSYEGEATHSRTSSSSGRQTGRHHRHRRHSRHRHRVHPLHRHRHTRSGASMRSSSTRSSGSAMSRMESGSLLGSASSSALEPGAGTRHHQRGGHHHSRPAQDDLNSVCSRESSSALYARRRRCAPPNAEAKEGLSNHHRSRNETGVENRDVVAPPAYDPVLHPPRRHRLPPGVPVVPPPPPPPLSRVFYMPPGGRRGVATPLRPLPHSWEGYTVAAWVYPLHIPAEEGVLVFSLHSEADESILRLYALSDANSGLSGASTNAAPPVTPSPLYFRLVQLRRLPSHAEALRVARTCREEMEEEDQEARAATRSAGLEPPHSNGSSFLFSGTTSNQRYRMKSSARVIVTYEHLYEEGPDGASRRRHRHGGATMDHLRAFDGHSVSSDESRDATRGSTGSSSSSDPESVNGDAPDLDEEGVQGASFSSSHRRRTVGRRYACPLYWLEQMVTLAPPPASATNSSAPPSRATGPLDVEAASLLHPTTTRITKPSATRAGNAREDETGGPVITSAAAPAGGRSTARGSLRLRNADEEADDRPEHISSTAAFSSSSSSWSGLRRLSLGAACEVYLEKCFRALPPSLPLRSCGADFPTPSGGVLRTGGLLPPATLPPLPPATPESWTHIAFTHSVSHWTLYVQGVAAVTLHNIHYPTGATPPQNSSTPHSRPHEHGVSVGTTGTGARRGGSLVSAAALREGRRSEGSSTSLHMEAAKEDTEGNDDGPRERPAWRSSPTAEVNQQSNAGGGLLFFGGEGPLWSAWEQAKQHQHRHGSRPPNTEQRRINAWCGENAVVSGNTKPLLGHHTTSADPVAVEKDLKDVLRSLTREGGAFNGKFHHALCGCPQRHDAWAGGGGAERGLPPEVDLFSSVGHQSFDPSPEVVWESTRFEALLPTHFPSFGAASSALEHRPPLLVADTSNFHGYFTGFAVLHGVMDSGSLYRLAQAGAALPCREAVRELLLGAMYRIARHHATNACQRRRSSSSHHRRQRRGRHSLQRHRKEKRSGDTVRWNAPTPAGAAPTWCGAKSTGGGGEFTSLVALAEQAYEQTLAQDFASTKGLHPKDLTDDPVEWAVDQLFLADVRCHAPSRRNNGRLRRLTQGRRGTRSKKDITAGPDGGGAAAASAESLCSYRIACYSEVLRALHCASYAPSSGPDTSATAVVTEQSVFVMASGVQVVPLPSLLHDVQERRLVQEALETMRSCRAEAGTTDVAPAWDAPPWREEEEEGVGVGGLPRACAATLDSTSWQTSAPMDGTAATPSSSVTRPFEASHVFTSAMAGGSTAGGAAPPFSRPNRSLTARRLCIPLLTTVLRLAEGEEQLLVGEAEVQRLLARQWAGRLKVPPLIEIIPDAAGAFLTGRRGDLQRSSTASFQNGQDDAAATPTPHQHIFFRVASPKAWSSPWLSGAAPRLRDTLFHRGEASSTRPLHMPFPTSAMTHKAWLWSWVMPPDAIKTMEEEIISWQRWGATDASLLLSLATVRAGGPDTPPDGGAECEFHSHETLSGDRLDTLNNSLGPPSQAKTSTGAGAPSTAAAHPRPPSSPAPAPITSSTEGLPPHHKGGGSTAKSGASVTLRPHGSTTAILSALLERLRGSVWGRAQRQRGGRPVGGYASAPQKQPWQKKKKQDEDSRRHTVRKRISDGTPLPRGSRSFSTMSSSTDFCKVSSASDASSSSSSLSSTRSLRCRGGSKESVLGEDGADSAALFMSDKEEEEEEWETDGHRVTRARHPPPRRHQRRPLLSPPTFTTALSPESKLFHRFFTPGRESGIAVHFSVSSTAGSGTTERRLVAGEDVSPIPLPTLMRILQEVSICMIQPLNAALLLSIPNSFTRLLQVGVFAPPRLVSPVVEVLEKLCKGSPQIRQTYQFLVDPLLPDRQEFMQMLRVHQRDVEATRRLPRVTVAGGTSCPTATTDTERKDTTRSADPPTRGYRCVCDSPAAHLTVFAGRVVAAERMVIATAAPMKKFGKRAEERARARLRYPKTSSGGEGADTSSLLLTGVPRTEGCASESGGGGGAVLPNERWAIQLREESWESWEARAKVAWRAGRHAIDQFKASLMCMLYEVSRADEGMLARLAHGGDASGTTTAASGLPEWIEPQAVAIPPGLPLPHTDVEKSKAPLATPPTLLFTLEPYRALDSSGGTFASWTSATVLSPVLSAASMARHLVPSTTAAASGVTPPPPPRDRYAHSHFRGLSCLLALIHGRGIHVNERLRLYALRILSLLLSSNKKMRSRFVKVQEGYALWVRALVPEALEADLKGRSTPGSSSLFAVGRGAAPTTLVAEEDEAHLWEIPVTLPTLDCLFHIAFNAYVPTAPRRLLQASTDGGGGGGNGSGSRVGVATDNATAIGGKAGATAGGEVPSLTRTSSRGVGVPASGNSAGDAGFPVQFHGFVPPGALPSFSFRAGAGRGGPSRSGEEDNDGADEKEAWEAVRHSSSSSSSLSHRSCTSTRSTSRSGSRSTSTSRRSSSDSEGDSSSSSSQRRPASRRHRYDGRKADERLSLAIQPPAPRHASHRDAGTGHAGFQTHTKALQKPPSASYGSPNNKRGANAPLASPAPVTNGKGTTASGGLEEDGSGGKQKRIITVPPAMELVLRGFGELIRRIAQLYAEGRRKRVQLVEWQQCQTASGNSVHRSTTSSSQWKAQRSTSSRRGGRRNRMPREGQHHHYHGHHQRRCQHSAGREPSSSIRRSASTRTSSSSARTVEKHSLGAPPVSHHHSSHHHRHRQEEREGKYREAEVRRWSSPHTRRRGREDAYRLYASAAEKMWAEVRSAESTAEHLLQEVLTPGLHYLEKVLDYVPNGMALLSYPWLEWLWKAFGPALMYRRQLRQYVQEQKQRQKEQHHAREGAASLLTTSSLAGRHPGRGSQAGEEAAEDRSSLSSDPLRSAREGAGKPGSTDIKKEEKRPYWYDAHYPEALTQLVALLFRHVVRKLTVLDMSTNPKATSILRLKALPYPPEVLQTVMEEVSRHFFLKGGEGSTELKQSTSRAQRTIHNLDILFRDVLDAPQQEPLSVEPSSGQALRVSLALGAGMVCAINAIAVNNVSTLRRFMKNESQLFWVRDRIAHYLLSHIPYLHCEDHGLLGKLLDVCANDWGITVVLLRRFTEAVAARDVQEVESVVYLLRQSVRSTEGRRTVLECLGKEGLPLGLLLCEASGGRDRGAAVDDAVVEAEVVPLHTHRPPSVSGSLSRGRTTQEHAGAVQRSGQTTTAAGGSRPRSMHPYDTFAEEDLVSSRWTAVGSPTTSLYFLDEDVVSHGRTSSATSDLFSMWSVPPHATPATLRPRRFSTQPPSPQPMGSSAPSPRHQSQVSSSSMRETMNTSSGSLPLLDRPGSRFHSRLTAQMIEWCRQHTEAWALIAYRIQERSRRESEAHGSPNRTPSTVGGGKGPTKPSVASPPPPPHREKTATGATNTLNPPPSSSFLATGSASGLSIETEWNQQLVKAREKHLQHRRDTTLTVEREWAAVQMDVIQLLQY